MLTGLTVGGDVERALEGIGVPSYVLDTTGGVRWINAAAERLVGDVRGRHFSSVVAPEDSRRARELFARKVLGTAASTDATGVLVSSAGARVAVEISSVPLTSGERVVGVFGLFEERPHDRTTVPHPHLTPARSRCFVCWSRALNQVDRRRVAPEHRDGPEPHPPALSGAGRQLAAGSGRRRAGRITGLTGAPAGLG
jgi:PAS domain S-box-containing protein